MSKRVVKVHLAQLAAVSWAHMLADLFSNILPPLLPAIRAHFGLGLLEGSVPVVLILLSSNWFQLAAGHLRASSRSRSFIYAGLILAVAVTGMGLVPQGPWAIWWLSLLAVVSGVGIAMVHPDALRAVHGLNRVRGATATGVFMASGFAGYALAGWVSTALFDLWGMEGLLALAVLPVTGIVLIHRMRVRPALEGSQTERGRALQIPFWMVIAMAIPAAISTTAFATLLPTRLVNELGFTLQYGGLSASVYGIGGAVGAVVWALVANRIGDLQAATLGLGLVVPLMVWYLHWMSVPLALVLLFLVGFFSFASYILLITLARSAKGTNLSMRMACVVGGTWGLANVAFLGLAHVAEVYGTLSVMGMAPAGYMVAGLLGLYLWSRYRVYA